MYYTIDISSARIHLSEISRRPFPLQWKKEKEEENGSMRRYNADLSVRIPVRFILKKGLFPGSRKYLA
jgi:hypothetical protein